MQKELRDTSGMEKQIDLITKYNRPAPRYTSYPPVPYWTNAPDESHWISHLQKSYDEKKGVDLYVHVPFCESLCYYCGCNRTITKNHDVEEKYLGLVLKEWGLYKTKLGFVPKINSLHFGGGTPTFLSSKNLESLIVLLLENKSEVFVGSVEVDPRTVLEAHLDVFKRHGINRVSLGIQDFDPLVQKAINRHQSPEMVSALVQSLRERHFDSINFDLIYGLPKQTLKSISETFDVVSDLRPDLIAFYSYAHLPEKIKNQRLIREEDLPTPQEKRELYLAGKKILEEKGYVEIGMDHFALPGSFLHKAMLEKKLHRNFMGYVDKKTGILIGLGPTSISDSSLSFVQNAKDIKSYEEAINGERLPLSTGHTHSKEDLLIQDLILKLMCQHELDLSSKESIPFWQEIKSDLEEFRNDGIIEFSGEKMMMRNQGKGFVRNVALSFDFHYRTKLTSAKFSQSI
ncbi:MAG: oxygen-independent coproporphyrinogen III oxidase [Bacteriovorax sp.]